MYSDFLTGNLPTGKLDNWYFFKKSFSQEEISRINALVDDGEIKTSQGTTFLGTKEKIRKSQVGWIPQVKRHMWIYERLSKLALEANKQMWNFDLVGMEEQAQYSVCPPEGGHYDWHIDIGSGVGRSNRKISICVQLSDPSEYEGGELVMKTGVHENPIERDLGLASVFPSYLLHRVTPVTRGERRSLVLWVTGPSFR